MKRIAHLGFRSRQAKRRDRDATARHAEQILHRRGYKPRYACMFNTVHARPTTDSVGLTTFLLPFPAITYSPSVQLPSGYSVKVEETREESHLSLSLSLCLSDSHRHREGRDARVTLASSGTSSARNGTQTFNRHLGELERAKRRSTIIVAWSDVICAVVSWFVPSPLLLPRSLRRQIDTIDTTLSRRLLRKADTRRVVVSSFLPGRKPQVLGSFGRKETLRAVHIIDGNLNKHYERIDRRSARCADSLCKVSV